MTLLHLVAGTRGADNETDKELKAWQERLRICTIPLGTKVLRVTGPSLSLHV